MEENNKLPKFSEFAGSTTLHGLNKTCDTGSHKARRLIWLFTFFLMLALYLYISISSIITYYQYESVTKITNTAKTELEFPSVSICLQNNFAKSLVQHNPELEFWIRYLETHRFLNLSNELRRNATDVLGTQPLLSAFFFDNRQGVMERCEFAGEEFACEELFTVVMSEVTVCLTFMQEEVRQRLGPMVTIAPGYLYGLNVWLNIDYDNYLSTSTLGAGVKVTVHPYEAYARISEKGLAIAPGSEAYLAIREERIENLPTPYSSIDCVNDDGPYKPKYGVLGVRTRYDFESCALDCMLELMFRRCNCRFEASPFCTLYDYYSCIKDKLSTFFPNCECLYPCKYTEYESRLSTLALPTPTYINHAVEHNLTHTTVDDIRQNVIILKVFFSDLKVTKIKQFKAYTAYELISNLGGQLGLFLGASLISIGELLEFLLQTGFYKIKGALNKRNASVHDLIENREKPPVVQREC